MTKKITKDEFLDRIRASDSTIQDAFSDEAIKALYSSFPEHYKEALSKTYKTFDVNSFLRKWQEFINIDTFFYCRPKFKTLDDVKEAGYTLIKFNDRVLIGT
jgi:hypothetical protein